MLRYQQQFDFFDPSRVGSDVHFLNLSEEALAGDLDGVLEADRRGGRSPASRHRRHRLVPVAGAHAAGRYRGRIRELEHFVQRLALHLTTWEITSFLIGEYTEQSSGTRSSPSRTASSGSPRR